MENQSECAGILQNLSKQKNTLPRNKMLVKAIEESDLSFLQEFLSSESVISSEESVSSEKNYGDILNLSRYYKSKLIPLLLEFINQPQRLEAIKCIYVLMNETGDVDVFSKVLLERSVDFNKLVFLKGKIDYLKYLQKNKNRPEEEAAENEYSE